VVSASCATIVVASLRFSRWVAERADRLAAANEPITPEVRTMKRATLLQQRESRAARLDLLIRQGHGHLVQDEKILIDEIDRELVSLDRRETA